MPAKTKTTEQFIYEAKQVHGAKYTYELVEYKNNKTKVKINCPIHGVFETRPCDHLSQSNGCAKCAIAEKGWTRTHFKDKCTKNNNGLGILYVLGCWDDDKTEVFIKIGITSLSIKKRYTGTRMPYNYKILHEIVGSPEYIYDLETLLHKKSKLYHYVPVIPFGGSSTECFIAEPTYLSKLNTYMSELIPF